MNKRFILIAVFLLIIKFSNAQTSAGSQTLGLYLGFSSNTYTNIPVGADAANGPAFTGKNSNFSFGPSYSYFVANDLDIGASIGLGSSTETNADNNFGYPLKYTNYQASGMLYARKYFLLKSKFGIRTGPYVAYSKSTANGYYVPAENIDNSHSDSRDFTAGIKFELVYYPSPKLGISANLASLQYEHSTSTGGFQLNQSSNGFSFNGATSGLLLSVFYVFGGKG
jgi:hypothetical protein